MKQNKQEIRALEIRETLPKLQMRIKKHTDSSRKAEIHVV